MSLEYKVGLPLKVTLSRDLAGNINKLSQRLR